MKGVREGISAEAAAYIRVQKLGGLTLQAVRGFQSGSSENGAQKRP